MSMKTGNSGNFFVKSALSILSGVLIFLAFPPFELAFIAWFSLVPLFYVIGKSTYRGSFFYSVITGLVFFGSLLYWLVNVTIPGMITLVIILALVYGVFGLFCRLIFKYSIEFLLVPFAWVIIEYIRSYLLTGFPWGLMAYTQYRNINLIQISDFMGAYGVSFVIVAFNVALYAWIIRSKRKIAYMMIALLFVLMSTYYGMYKLNNNVPGASAEVSVVQGNIPQEFKWDPGSADSIVEKYISLTKDAAREYPDMIVWPETAYPYLYEAGEDLPKEISKISKDMVVPILTGLVYRDGSEYLNSAVLFDGKKGIADIYSKVHLVPFGEYIPLAPYSDFLRDYIDKPIGDFGRGDEYTLFRVRSTVSRTTGGAIVRQQNYLKFGVLICFEDVFPYVSREFVLRGANFLVNITNDAWFQKTSASRQHMQSAVFRAVENRVPVVRCANTGISGFIDYTGKITGIIEEDGEEIFISGVTTSDIETYPGKSFYTVYGDIFIYLSGFMLIFVLLVEGLALRKRKED